MVGRLVGRSSFDRLLATAPCSRSAHFAVHHVSTPPDAADSKATDGQLSTREESNGKVPVDNLPAAILLGTMTPKRHARRAVTRNLLRRQMREAVTRHSAGLDPGLWLIRLRAAFAADAFDSAASAALRRAAADELDRLLLRVVR